METKFKKTEIQKAESVYTATLILVSHFVAKYTQILGNSISLSSAKRDCCYQSKYAFTIIHIYTLLAFHLKFTNRNSESRSHSPPPRKELSYTFLSVLI